MGNKSKRDYATSESDSSDDEIQILKRKFRKLERLLEKREKSRSRHARRPSSSDPDVIELSESNNENDYYSEDDGKASGETDPLKIEFVEVPSLKDGVLSALGEVNENPEANSIEIHENLIPRWDKILKNGLDEKTKTLLSEKYSAVKNCTTLIPPKLNPEVKRAIPENAVNRDCRLTARQGQLGCVLGALGKALTSLLKTQERGEEPDQLILIEVLSDAARLLADIYHGDTESRRDLASVSLNKDLKDTITNVVVDGWLFGDNLSERIKTAKQLERSGNELKSKTQNKSKSTRYLNSKSPLRVRTQLSGRPQFNRHQRFQNSTNHDERHLPRRVPSQQTKYSSSKTKERARGRY